MSNKSKGNKTTTSNSQNRETTKIKEPPKLSRTAKIAIPVVIILALIIAIIICWQPLMAFLHDPSQFADSIKAMGWSGVIVFFFINAIHVILPIIPAGPFSMAAGLVWGSWVGTFICLVSSTFFSTILYLWIKKSNPDIARQILEIDRLAKVKKYLESGRVARTMFVLFLIPASPKDFLAWIGGLLEITLPEWLVINMIGRFPGVFLTAAAVSGLKSGNYVAVIGVVVIAILFYVIGTIIKKKYFPDDNEESEGAEA